MNGHPEPAGRGGAGETLSFERRYQEMLGAGLDLLDQVEQHPVGRCDDPRISS